QSNLKGYTDIPGVPEKLIANLFADDTTVFLAEDDSFEELQNILDRWCLASTAVFNIAKTQILPIGKEEYRLRIIADRCGNLLRSCTPCNRARGHRVSKCGRRVGQ
ncbi:hypothetical protein F5051DRAFT_340325, partial [Lentinula edodes]